MYTVMYTECKSSMVVSVPGCSYARVLRGDAWTRRVSGVRGGLVSVGQSGFSTGGGITA